MKILKVCFTTLIALFLTSCELDDSDSSGTLQSQNPDSTAFSENFGDEISRNFLGTVVDINNIPISNVMITIGNSTATTDNNGVFIINSATVNQRFGYIKAEKTGYIHASRAVVPSEGTNKVHIMMLPETVVGTTASGTQEAISLPNGASVGLEGDYIKADGTAYDGNVNVIMHLLDPTDEDMEDQMPGMLYAANAQNEERMLQTFGMLAVELRGENGQDLNLAEGSSAEIKIPLDESLILNAPNTIPLWYFDEVNGYWVEEGEATLVGNQYIGMVSHFSFWNYDIPREAEIVCIKLVNDIGNTIPNQEIILHSSNLNQTTSGITNELGQVCGYMPLNESLELTINGNGSCTIAYEDTIGPITEEQVITIVLDGTDLISETIVGNFVDCDQNPIINGYALINTGEFSSFENINNGMLQTTVLRCADDSDFSIEAYDTNTLQSASQTNVAFTSPETNIGTISTCSDIDEYIEYTIDSTQNFLFTEISVAELEYNLDDQSFPIETYLIQIETTFGNFPEEDCFRLIGILTQDFNTLVGSYDYWYFQDPNDNMGITFNGNDCGHAMTLDNTALFNINSIGEVGEYIDITFELDYFDFNGQPHTMEGSIHVLRDLGN
ncbi:carboxypeptidase-like regulatory domain-containing protein [uncultured Psychroserpens sp.]|uniref:carboxypeptidase-like regulatory domain-containing protein n=1 Tax=uncultured Psychroserpens sp. TaxID=255436 RepID=UPI00261C3F8D|nr:carboxypeptidase-like regulatory domain-containing protein [uncultured Psychroserpens sp.]